MKKILYFAGWKWEKNLVTFSVVVVVRRSRESLVGEKIDADDDADDGRIYFWDDFFEQKFIQFD